jgi:hypothetical protein
MKKHYRLLEERTLTLTCGNPLETSRREDLLAMTSRLLEGAHAISHNLGIGEMMRRSTYPFSHSKHGGDEVKIEE